MYWNNYNTEVNARITLHYGYVRTQASYNWVMFTHRFNYTSRKRMNPRWRKECKDCGKIYD